LPTEYGLEWFRLHPNVNPTGTDTLRFSCSNPNTQQVSGQEVECPECNGEGCINCDGTGKDLYSLRLIFGPVPGREWWSLDAKNIERRIPAYYANETDIINLFERPNDPPYFGSEHLLTAHAIFPKEFESCKDANGQVDGRIFKKKCLTLYKATKNFNFATQYQCGEAKGDATAGVRGAWKRVKYRFAKQTKLNDDLVAFAEKHGYIETIPDKSLECKRGYPILCTRTEWGKVLSTTPFNYWSQGTACQWMVKAKIRVAPYLLELNNAVYAKKLWGPGGYHMILTVHDELVFDFPKGRTVEPWQENLSKVQKIRQLMEEGGEDISIPVPVSIEYHAESWSEGKTIA
jgi:hypothetical protein